MNSTIKNILITGIVIVLLILWLFLYPNNNKEHNYTLLSSQEYPIQKATIETFYIDPLWFWPHQVKVDLVIWEGERRTLVDDILYNDWSNLSQKNIWIERVDEWIEVTLRWSEQEDVMHRISFD